MNNKSIASHLQDVAFFYRMENQSFKASAYEKASVVILSLSKEISFNNSKMITKLPGVGKSIQTTIEEFYNTGISKKYTDFINQGAAPPSIRELTKIPKVGVQTAKKLFEKFNIKTLEDFESKIDLLNQTEFEKYIEGFNQIKNASERLPADVVKYTIDLMIQPLILEGWDLTYAGSMRRKRETIRDVDLIVYLRPGFDDKEKLKQYFETNYGLTPNVRDGEDKLGIDIPILDQMITLDLNFCLPKQYGMYLNYLTGSKEFNIRCRSECKAKQLLLNQKGVFDQNGNQIDDGTEQDLFRILNIPYVPPECREEGAYGKDFSNLIEYQDIIIDLHTHSNQSDGLFDYDKMTASANTQQLKVLGISDHSPGSGKGPKQNKKLELIQQFKELKDTFPLRVLYSAEVDVKANKQLDYSVDLIEQLDYVIFALHKNSDQNVEERFITAINCFSEIFPKVLAHPTGRHLHSGKQSVEADWNKIFEICKKTNTVIEINGQPDRKDCPPELIKKGLEVGVYFLIGSDCHSIDFRQLLNVGVDVGRRGWLTKDKCLNCSEQLLDKWLEGKLYD